MYKPILVAGDKDHCGQDFLRRSFFVNSPCLQARSHVNKSDVSSGTWSDGPGTAKQSGFRPMKSEAVVPSVETCYRRQDTLRGSWTAFYNRWGSKTCGWRVGCAMNPQASEPSFSPFILAMLTWCWNEAMCCQGQGQRENEMLAKGRRDGRTLLKPEEGRMRAVKTTPRMFTRWLRKAIGAVTAVRRGMSSARTPRGPEWEQVGLLPVAAGPAKASFPVQPADILVTSATCSDILLGPRNRTKNRALGLRVEFYKCSGGIVPWWAGFSFSVAFQLSS